MSFLDTLKAALFPSALPKDYEPERDDLLQEVRFVIQKTNEDTKRIQEDRLVLALRRSRYRPEDER